MIAGMAEVGVPLAPPIFGRSDSPIPTRGGWLYPPQSYCPSPFFYLPLSLNCSAPSRTKGCFLAKAFGFMSARRRSILRRWREFMQKQKCTFYTKKRSFSREKAKHLTVSLYTLCILRNTYWPSSSLYVLCIVSMNDDLVCRRPCLILLTYNLVNGCKRQLVNTDSHLNWKRFKHARRWPHSSYYAAI